MTYSIELPNHETILVKAFAYDSDTHSIVILFECNTEMIKFSQKTISICLFLFSFAIDQYQYTLYAGRFIANGNILKYSCLRNLLLNEKIDDLYIDVHAAHVREFNLMRKACNEIVSLVGLVVYVLSTNCYSTHVFQNN